MAGDLERLKPRIAVVGSCVSRDVFNTRILGEEYKDDVAVVATAYQVALPSLAREQPIAIDLADRVKSSHKRFIAQELSGRSLTELVSARPDVIILDFFADVHFGVAIREDQPLTRNNMAFESFQEAECYFDEQANERLRLESVGDSYTTVALDSLDKLVKRFSDADISPDFIVNSGRYATSYVVGGGSERSYERNIQHLRDRNLVWDELDRLVAGHLKSPRIEYPEELIVGDVMHAWGLHPVHYRSAYYKYMWQSVKHLMRE
jgi:hypothetical protein